MSKDGQGTEWRRNIAENFNRLSRVHERYTGRRQTDGRATAYSKRKREFTFVHKMYCKVGLIIFHSASQCSRCKRCTSYGNSVRPSVCPSVTRRYCVKTTARSTVQFACQIAKCVV